VAYPQRWDKQGRRALRKNFARFGKRSTCIAHLCRLAPYGSLMRGSLFSYESSVKSIQYRETNMADLLFVVCTIFIFALGAAYLKGCERLK
jgi:hypothetical protein